jgi:hypothetical protein
MLNVMRFIFKHFKYLTTGKAEMRKVVQPIVGINMISSAGVSLLFYCHFQD